MKFTIAKEEGRLKVSKSCNFATIRSFIMFKQNRAERIVISEELERHLQERTFRLM